MPFWTQDHLNLYTPRCFRADGRHRRRRRILRPINSTQIVEWVRLPPSRSTPTGRPRLTSSFTPTIRLPRPLLYGYTSSPNKTMRCPFCSIETAGCVSILAPTEHSCLHLMVATSVNLPCHTLLTTLIPAVPRTSEVAGRRPLYINEIRRPGMSLTLSPTSPGEPNPPQRTPRAYRPLYGGYGHIPR